MKNAIKFLTIAILISISFLAVNAQEQSFVSVNETPAATEKVEKKETIKKRQSSNDDYYKTEIYGGYSWMKPTQGTIAFSKDDSPQGYEVSVTRNFNRFFGVKFATGGNFKTTREFFPNIAEVQKNTFYTYSGGVQIADNRKSSRVRPFAHILVGGIHHKDHFTSTFTSASGAIFVDHSNESENKFMMVFGGGINVRVGQKISVRPIQFDYLRTNGGLCCLTSNGFIRLGAGINFNF